MALWLLKFQMNLFRRRKLVFYAFYSDLVYCDLCLRLIRLDLIFLDLNYFVITFFIFFVVVLLFWIRYIIIRNIGLLHRYSLATQICIAVEFSFG